MQSQSLPDAASRREIESTTPSQPSGRPRFKITTGRALAAIGTLAVVGIIIANLVGGPPPPSDNNHPTTNQPIPSTQPPATPPTSPPQPATPPRAFTGRILDHRGLSVDTSSEFYSKSYLHGVPDSVVITVGHSEARSISDNNYQKT